MINKFNDIKSYFSGFFNEAAPADSNQQPLGAEPKTKKIGGQTVFAEPLKSPIQYPVSNKSDDFVLGV